MKALVTGARGFVGRHVVEELKKRDYEVFDCDLVGSASVHDNLHRLVQWNTNVYDLVVHAAAVSPHRAAIDGQPATFVQNMNLDATLFEWAINTKQKRVLYISSSAAYPVELQRLYTTGDLDSRLAEDEIDLDYPELADGRYGFAKLAGEHLARATREFGVPVTIVRPFSGYGGTQGTEWPFGAFLARARALADVDPMPFLIWGSAEQRRDWIHISDLVKGMFAVAESETEDPVNLCTGQGTAMGDLAQLMMKELTGVPEWDIEVDITKPLGVMNRVGDPSKFFEYYQPEITIEEGVVRALRKEDK